VGTADVTKPSFDPRRHRVVAEQRWFDDFRRGKRFPLASRTMTEAIYLAFQAASGDNHPIHYDIEYCRARGLPHMLAPVAGAGIFPT
jgi:acyl dehydratase